MICARRQHQERFVEWKARATDSDLLFLHRLEQRGLHLGRRAIDLVGENNVREYRALLDGKPAARLVVDLCADDVGREQVRRKLNAAERRRDGFSEGTHGQCLGEAGYAFEEHVAAREERDDEALDHGLLTHHAARDLREHGLDERVVNCRRCGLRHGVVRLGKR